MSNLKTLDIHGNHSHLRIGWRMAIFAVLATFAIASTAAPSSKPVFHPAELVSAEGIFRPILSVASGPVILEASVGADGVVTDVVATYPIASLSEPSIRAIRNWKFKPATFDEKPVESRVTVAVLFNSHIGKPYLLPVESQDQNPRKGRAEYESPEVVSIEGAPVGNAIVGDGSVVLQAKITGSGELLYASVVRDSPPFTPLALKAIQNWQFKAAQFGGSPISSTLPVVFVFQIIPETTY
jgi:Gram-negative bacterial TonB protein C-terminal